MKFINYLEKITGVDVYGMTSLLLFFIIFIIMGIYAFTADKKFIDAMKNSPLYVEEK